MSQRVNFSEKVRSCQSYLIMQSQFQTVRLVVLVCKLSTSVKHATFSNSCISFSEFSSQIKCGLRAIPCKFQQRIPVGCIWCEAELWGTECGSVGFRRWNVLQVPCGELFTLKRDSWKIWATHSPS